MPLDLTSQATGLQSKGHAVPSYQDPSCETPGARLSLQPLEIQVSIKVGADQDSRRTGDGQLHELVIRKMARIDDGKIRVPYELDLLLMKMRVARHSIGPASIVEPQAMVPSWRQACVAPLEVTSPQTVFDFPDHDSERCIDRIGKTDDREKSDNRFMDSGGSEDTKVPGSRVDGRIEAGVNERHQIRQMIGVKVR